MAIRSVQVQRFRSINGTGLPQCGGLNVLIGRNNAGKSNLLSAIELVLVHMKRGRIAGSWPTNRPRAEFTNRDESAPVRVGIEFDLSSDINQQLGERLTKEAPHLERSIEQIKSHSTIVFVLAAATQKGTGYLFIEQIAVGKLVLTEDKSLSTDGIRLLTVTKDVGYELYNSEMTARAFQSDLRAIDEVRPDRPPFEFFLQQEKHLRAHYVDQFFRSARQETRGRIVAILQSVNTLDELSNGLASLAAQLRESMEAAAKRDLEGTVAAFAGDTKTRPAYAEWLIQQFGAVPFLHIKETKEPIGQEEAETLLKLKVRRGGPEQLVIIQQSVRSLLGVDVDAFQGETSEQKAEMDVDDFLVAANGAGIRESLRLILDLELKNPQLVLIEEPEIHLHPGLSRVMANYLREKARDIQMFVTTHSTDFVDSVSFKNVFLISRDSQNKTVCRAVEADEGASQIPAELGLRLSTVFMFERIVFVEGPSDENVLRELAAKLSLDLARYAVGFVYMRGVRNFAHFAAEATLDLLSRRRIEIWFVTDRDESEDAEVNRMVARLSGRAKLIVLRKREIENYLLNEVAIAAFVDEKQKAGGSNSQRPELEAVRNVIDEEAAKLKAELVRLRLERRLLKPVFLHTRAVAGTIEERIRSAIDHLTQRFDGIEAQKTAVTQEIDRDWPSNALDCVPGTLLLEKVALRFGVTFSKDRGDTERLARLLPGNSIDVELTKLLHEIAPQ